MSSSPRPFRTLLVANRGEIACRVMRTARALGYRTVAVFSDADEGAPHVALADVAVRIGEAPAAKSYLSIEAILDAARRTGADAVHPGYGFLSERAAFARAVEEAGLVFVGPPASAIEAMGDKAGAKRRMLAAGVPCVPGWLGEAGHGDAMVERYAAEAERVGYPLLVKATAGGGGRGMRLVREPGELAAALASARREAESSFGDGSLMLERLVEEGHHIEIQVFADRHGNAVHLGERDCTAQRRRQKVIEEAPSPIVSAELRERMGRDAVAAALAVGYVGAGTVEFIVEVLPESEGGGLRHYFLEMNTRLQVEHPVTEAITGLDLVEWQLRVATGEPLPLSQSALHFSGHAIEVRLYAEDPWDGFRPQTGRVLHFRPGSALGLAQVPSDGSSDGPGGPPRAPRPGVRIDAGIAEGQEIGPHYDAMVAKVIAHGRDRAEAIRKLGSALVDVPLLGLVNNGRYLHDLVNHPDFVAARIHTRTLDAWAESNPGMARRPAPPDEALLVAAALRALAAEVNAASNGGAERTVPSLRALGPRPASVGSFDLSLVERGVTRRLRARPHGEAVSLRFVAGGAAGNDTEHVVRLLGWDAVDDHRLHVEVGGVRRAVTVVLEGRRVHLAWEGAGFVFEEPSAIPSTESAVDPRRVKAQVAGAVMQVLVRPGEPVVRGQNLVCIEAMKMELWATAAADGVVEAVRVKAGEQVALGALLVELAEPGEPKGS